MYYLNKVVGWVLSPHGILIFGLMAGWLIRPWRKCLLGMTIVIFWFLSTGIGGRAIGVPLEGDEVDEGDDRQVEHCDAIVLLGGGMGIHAKCGRAEMYGAADRVWHAAKLWKRYHTEGDGMKMTLSGNGADKSTIPLLRDLGVSDGVFLYFPEARNTEEEAKLIYTSGIRRIMLVTSAWHMPRAQMLFEKAGFDVIPKPCDYEMHCGAERAIEFGDFIPNAEAAARCAYALKEWIARLGYAIRYIGR